VSEKNGEIVCVRFFGSWRVLVGGYEESSPYMRRLWQYALRRVPKNVPIKKVLILGLGAGQNISQLHQRFLKCKITAIEWDPVMVEIANQLKMYPQEWRPQILLADVEQAVETLREKFDLILFDIYTANRILPSVNARGFISQMVRLLKSDGYLLFNANIATELSTLEIIGRNLRECGRWRYRWNTIALFRHFGCGMIGDPLPRGYQPFHSVDEYLRRESFRSARYGLGGVPGVHGLRWHHGPLWFERYTTDQEPTITPFDHWRMVIWQPIIRLDTPLGWRRSWIQMNARKTCFAEILEPQNYWAEWSSHAQRHRRRWLKQQEFVGGEVALEEFIEAYRKCRKLMMLKEDFIKILRRKAGAHGGHVHYFIARHVDTGDIRAGLAVLDIPEAQQSVHIISFIQPDAEAWSVGFGLIDVWFKHGIDHHLRFLDFDLFWAPGDPRGWKGYSNFKRQFGVRYIRYPNPLVKFVRGSK